MGDGDTQPGTSPPCPVTLGSWQGLGGLQSHQKPPGFGKAARGPAVPTGNGTPTRLHTPAHACTRLHACPRAGKATAAVTGQRSPVCRWFCRCRELNLVISLCLWERQRKYLGKRLLG